MSDVNVGIVGIGVYIPKGKMTAKELAIATNGQWSEEAVIEKLGIVEKVMPVENDGTEEMAVKAALDCLKNTGVNPMDLDVVMCVGEEWKEYPLTTSALYIQDKIGALNAWGIDVQDRCSTTVTAMKIAKDMLVADDDINIILIVGGYRNCDFINYEDKDLTMMYDLSAGAGAIILKKNYGKNLLLGTHIISDGSMSHTIGVNAIGNDFRITSENLQNAYKSLKVIDPHHLRKNLNELSLSNWEICINRAFEKSKIEIKDLDYLAILHIKRSLHNTMLKKLNLAEDQTIYLDHYGHMGQVDQILSLYLALEQNKIKEGSIVSMMAAGIGFIWAVNVIRWG